MGLAHYEPSDSALSAIGITATILSIVSTGFCLIVLIAAAWVYYIPETRHTIDRISFRLMIWSMLFGMGYDMCYFLAEPRFAIFSPSSTQCKVVMYWQVVTMGAVNYFITCIAINLMLSVHFALNPLTLRLERWYIIISLFIAFVVPIVPAALGHFGADPVYEACYFTAPNLKDRLRNFILDLYLWQGAASLIACTCVAITLTSLFRSGRATAKALLYRDASNITPTEISEETSTTWCPKSFFKRRSSSTFQLQDQFMSIALRVALYPVVLVVTNAILTTGDLYLSASGSVKNRAEYGLYIVYYMLYGGRNILLAAIGMFIDPGLPRGVRMAWRLARSTPAPMAELDDEGDLDFLSALNSTPCRETISRRSALDRLRKTTSFRADAGESLDSSSAIIYDPSPKWLESGFKDISEEGDSRESDDIPETPQRPGSDMQEPRERSLEEEEESARRQEQEKNKRKEEKEETAKANLKELVHRL